MLELMQFPPGFGLMNASPFCMKVEVFLRLAKLPYRCNNGASPLRAPKRKLPVLRDGSATVADSAAILQHLQTQHGHAMPAALREAETAKELLLRHLFEDHLYFALLWLRWVDDAGFAAVQPVFFGGMPRPVGALVSRLARGKMRRDLMGQGMGRHRKEDICAQAIADLHAAEACLGSKPYFHGNEPGAIDATTYAFIANLLWVPMANPVSAHAQQLPGLVAYGQRMRALVGQA